MRSIWTALAPARTHIFPLLGRQPLPSVVIIQYSLASLGR
jgi:hypothetical protein